MAAKHTLSEALKTIRKARGLSQEAFSDVSSRTYMSSLERDLKSPTLNKLAELCEVMEVHPLTLLTLAYAGDDAQRAEQLLAQVRQELEAMLAAVGAGGVEPLRRHDHFRGVTKMVETEADARKLGDHCISKSHRDGLQVAE